MLLSLLLCSQLQCSNLCTESPGMLYCFFYRIGAVYLHNKEWISITCQNIFGSCCFIAQTDARVDRPSITVGAMTIELVYLRRNVAVLIILTAAVKFAVTAEGNEGTLLWDLQKMYRDWTYTSLSYYLHSHISMLIHNTKIAISCFLERKIRKMDCIPWITKLSFRGWPLWRD